MSDDRSTDFVLDQFERFVTTIAGMDVPEGGFEDADIVKATSKTIEEIQDLRAENRELRDTIDALTDIGGEKTTKEEKIASIVTWAERQASNPREDRVAVKVREIVGATGVSRRYAYDLIDTLPDEYDWLLDRHDVSQYGDLELDKDGMDRALVVDFERLHSDEGSVNKFTTTTATKVVAD